MSIADRYKNEILKKGTVYGIVFNCSTEIDFPVYDIIKFVKVNGNEAQLFLFNHKNKEWYFINIIDINRNDFCKMMDLVDGRNLKESFRKCEKLNQKLYGIHWSWSWKCNKNSKVTQWVSVPSVIPAIK